MTPRALSPLIAAAALFASLQSFADDQATIYKGVDAHGVTVYSSTPQGLRNAQKVKLPDPPISGADGYPSRSAQAPEAPKAADPDAKRRAIQAAQDALDQAVKAQASGKEPLPGERQGTVGGGSRLTPPYFARQDDLAAAVAKAQADLDAASQR